MKRKKTSFIGERRGQVMIMTILALGGTILGATTIAGLLMVYQIRQATDAANSTKAVFAADAGLGWAFYQFFNSTSTISGPIFANGATVDVRCYEDADGTQEIDCRNASTTLIKSIGTANKVSRAFQISF